MISGKILRDAIISGANNINNQRSRVDELNVFPVPDLSLIHISEPTRPD